jgi:hypothetical protein
MYILIYSIHCSVQECEDVDREMPVVTCEQIKLPSAAGGAETSSKLELAEAELVPAAATAVVAEAVVPAVAAVVTEAVVPADL